MKLSKKDFLNSRKAITLIGMSGAGKTHISSQLQHWGWYNYSCDYVIGDEYLRDELRALNLGEFSVENIGALSVYLGKLGNAQYGGFDLATFKQRQEAYYDAECKALNVMGDVLNRTDKPFVHDSTGSLCEIEDQSLLQKIGEQTLFVYLKTNEQGERDVLKRAYEYPKPLFFPKSFLIEKIAMYLADHGLNNIDDIEPDEFSRWVFPLLFEARKPKYQRLADLYGITIPCTEFSDLSSADEFIEIIANHLDD